MKYVVVELAENQVISAHIEDNDTDALDYATDVAYKVVMDSIDSDESEEEIIASIIPSGCKEDAAEYPSVREAIYSILSENNEYNIGEYSISIVTAT